MMAETGKPESALVSTSEALSHDVAWREAAEAPVSPGSFQISLNFQGEERG